MPEEVFLDSNIAVKHLRRKPSVVTAKMAEIDQLYLSETVLGELYYGAYHGEHTESELAKIVMERVEDRLNPELSAIHWR